MKTAIFLSDKEIDLLIELVKRHEEEAYPQISKKENDELFDLINTIKARGVEIKEVVDCEDNE